MKPRVFHDINSNKMGQTEFPVKFMEDPKADTPALPHLHLQEQLETQGLEIVNDGTVRWKEGNPQHPRNWPVRKKVYNAVVVIFLDFFMYGCRFLAPQKLVVIDSSWEQISRWNSRSKPTIFQTSGNPPLMSNRHQRRALLALNMESTAV